MKSLYVKIISAVLVVAVSIVGMANVDRVGAREGSSWMTALDDATLIKDMSIPGTHDSGALHSIADVSGRCQTLGIESQLKAGVRFLDIRLKQVGESLVIVHDFLDQKSDFGEAVEDVADFLRKESGEFIMVSIKEDYSPVDPIGSFDEAVKRALAAHTDVFSYSNTLPATLGEARGKAYIFARYSSDVGIDVYWDWRDDTSFEINGIYVQDNYCVDSAEEKISDIRDTLSVAGSGNYDLVINFASCYIDSGFPPTYAGTPARSINRWLLDNLGDVEGCVGVVLCDFVTEELARAIYGRNAL